MSQTSAVEPYITRFDNIVDAARAVRDLIRDDPRVGTGEFATAIDRTPEGDFVFRPILFEQGTPSPAAGGVGYHAPYVPPFDQTVALIHSHPTDPKPGNLDLRRDIREFATDPVYGNVQLGIVIYETTGGISYFFKDGRVVPIDPGRPN